MNEDRKNTPTNENPQETLPEEALLTAYALGELSADEAAQFESRLAADESLQKEVQEIHRFGQWLTDALENEPIENEPLENEQPAKIPPEKVPQLQPTTDSPSRYFRLHRVYATLAAAVVLLACVSVLWLTGNQTPNGVLQHVAVESVKHDQPQTASVEDAKEMEPSKVDSYEKQLKIGNSKEAPLLFDTAISENAEMDAETTAEEALTDAISEKAAMDVDAEMDEEAAMAMENAAPMNAAMMDATPAMAPAPESVPAMDDWNYGADVAMEAADADIGVMAEAAKVEAPTPVLDEAESMAPQANVVFQSNAAARNKTAREAASELQSAIPTKIESQNAAVSKDMAFKAESPVFQQFDGAMPSAAAPAALPEGKSSQAMKAPQAKKFAAPASAMPQPKATFQKIADHPTVSLELKCLDCRALNMKFGASRSSSSAKSDSRTLGATPAGRESRKLKSRVSPKLEKRLPPTESAPAPAVEKSASALVPAESIPEAEAPAPAVEPAVEESMPEAEAAVPAPVFAPERAAAPLVPSASELAQREAQRLRHLLLERHRLPTRNQIHTTELLRYFTENEKSPQADSTQTGNAPALNVEIHPHPGKPDLYLAKVTLRHAEKLAARNVLLNLRFQPEHVAGCRRIGGVPTLGDTTTLLYELQPAHAPSSDASAVWLTVELGTPTDPIASASGQPDSPAEPTPDFQFAAAISLFASALYGDLPSVETLETVQALCKTIVPSSEETQAKLREFQELVQAAQDLVR